MKWITRERPKIDRIACPWLIKRFVDQEAEFIYVPFEQVLVKSKELDAVPFDLPDVEYTHYGEECTFDYIIKKHKLTDPALNVIARIVRGADTDRHDTAPQSSGLWAISAGIAENIKDDHELLSKGIIIYDGLYTWAKSLQNVKHTENPIENLLLDVYKKFLKQRSGYKKIPPGNGLIHLTKERPFQCAAFGYSRQTSGHQSTWRIHATGRSDGR